jgi:hypothetical protein
MNNLQWRSHVLLTGGLFEEAALCRLFNITATQTVELWYLSQYSVCLQTGRPGFDPRQRQMIVPLASVSRPSLKPTQPPIHCVPGFSRG